VSLVRAVARRILARVAPGWYQRRATLLGARDWDMVAEPDEQFYAREYLHHLRPALSASGAKRVLDLGCGQGRIAIPLAREGYRVTAVDWSPEALERARGYAREQDAPDFVRADIVPWLGQAPDAAYDAVLALEVLYMMPAWRDVLREIHRVTAPGGCCALGFRPRAYYLRYCLERRDLAALGHVEAGSEGPIGGIVLNWHGRDEIVEILRAIGFRDVTCAGIGVFSGIAGDPSSHLARPSALDAREQEALFALEMRYAERLADDGRYCLALARK
jgi:SAM-dependent methyltransferase